jgi:hypothetical protein
MVGRNLNRETIEDFPTVSWYGYEAHAPPMGRPPIRTTSPMSRTVLAQPWWPPAARPQNLRSPAVCRGDSMRERPPEPSGYSVTGRLVAPHSRLTSAASSVVSSWRTRAWATPRRRRANSAASVSVVPGTRNCARRSLR